MESCNEMINAAPFDSGFEANDEQICQTKMVIEIFLCFIIFK